MNNLVDDGTYSDRAGAPVAGELAMLIPLDYLSHFTAILDVQFYITHLPSLLSM